MTNMVAKKNGPRLPQRPGEAPIGAKIGHVTTGMCNYRGARRRIIGKTYRDSSRQSARNRLGECLAGIGNQHSAVSAKTENRKIARHEIRKAYNSGQKFSEKQVFQRSLMSVCQKNPF